MITQTHRLDVVPGGITTVVHVKQYQTDESLVFELFSRFGDFEISAAFTECTVRGTKSDGNGYSANATCDPSNNSVTVQLTEQMTAVAGRQPYEITVTDSTGRMITTTFILDVHRAALDAGTVESESVIKEVGTAVTEYLDSGAADDIIDATVEEWMDNHPEASTTVENNSITEIKINTDFLPFIKNDYATPEMFGAKGNGTADDTVAFQEALDAAEIVVLDGAKTYLCLGVLRIGKGTVLEMNGATLAGPDTADGLWQIFNFEETDTFTGYNGNGNIEIRNGRFLRSTFSFMHGENILIENCAFEDARRSHFIEICACRNVTIRDCSFKGMTLNYTAPQVEYINIDNCTADNFPHLPADSVMFDGTVDDGVLIDNCVFDRNNTSMADAVGKHARYDADHPELNRAKNITIRDCTVYGATETAFLFRSCDDILIENCKAYSCRELYYLKEVDNAKITNCYIEGQTNFNTISTAENVVVTNNTVILNGSTDSWDIQLQREVDNLNYSYNNYVNSYGGRLPICFGYRTSGDDQYTTTVTKMKAVGNVYNVNGQRRGLFALPDSSSGVTVSFEQVDDCNIIAPQNEYTAVTSAFTLTNFNRIVLYVGAPSYSTLSEIVIAGYPGSNIAVGNVYQIPVNMAAAGQVGLVTVTVTDAHTLTTTGQKIRFVKSQRI